MKVLRYRLLGILNFTTPNITQFSFTINADLKVLHEFINFFIEIMGFAYDDLRLHTNAATRNICSLLTNGRGGDNIPNQRFVLSSLRSCTYIDLLCSVTMSFKCESCMNSSLT